jgi:hypothetical protein
VLTATVTWFMQDSVSGFDAASADPSLATSYANVYFDQLDLELFLVTGYDGDGKPIVGNPVAASISGWDPSNPTATPTGWDSVEQLYLGVPATGQYMLEVLWDHNVFDYLDAPDNPDPYALAWSVADPAPEPSSALLLGLGAALLLRRRRVSGCESL